MTGFDYWNTAYALIDQIVLSYSPRKRGRIRSKLLWLAGEKAKEHLDPDTYRQFEAAREAWSWRT